MTRLLICSDNFPGYRYDETAHQCMRDVLIIKKKGGIGLIWVKVRSRPDTKGHYGPYKICAQFSQSRPCKVGEEKCTFPHHQAELNLWTLDREGSFSVENFVTQCRTFKMCKYPWFLTFFYTFIECHPSYGNEVTSQFIDQSISLNAIFDLILHETLSSAGHSLAYQITFYLTLALSAHLSYDCLMSVIVF